MNSIPVLVDTSAPQSGTLGLLDSTVRIEALDVDRLRQSLAGLTEQITMVLQDIRRVGSFQLSQVQLQVEITSEGGVALVGTIKAGVKGGIVLTFTP